MVNILPPYVIPRTLSLIIYLELIINYALWTFFNNQFNVQFFYSITICMLHPRHVSNINMPIFRRTNCIITASGIFALCKRLHSTLVESGQQSALNQCTVQTFTESEDTRCCVNTIFPPEDGHVNARNMSRIIM